MRVYTMKMRCDILKRLLYMWRKRVDKSRLTVHRMHSGNVFILQILRYNYMIILTFQTLLHELFDLFSRQVIILRKKGITRERERDLQLLYSMSCT